MKFLSVGLACLDVINVCTSYPLEDSDQRCISQRWSRGGNAANISTVLSQLISKYSDDDASDQVDCLATIADEPISQFLIHDFIHHNISTKHLIRHGGCDPPCSCVIINASNGSRTIVHSNQNLPEVSVQDFKTIPLRDYTWIHFEGRNIDNVKEMIGIIQKYNENISVMKEGEGAMKESKIIISVEVEKVKVQMDELLGLGDFVFISKDYAMHRGYSDMRSAVEGLYTECKQGSVLFCGWGDKGAGAKTIDSCYTTPAFPLSKVVDTLGAGDTFIASTIFYLHCKGASIPEAMREGCRVAGLKCSHEGLDITSLL